MGQARNHLSFRQIDSLFRLADGIRLFIDRSLTEELQVDSIDVRILMYVAQRSDSDQRCIATDIWKWICIPKATCLRKINLLKQVYLTEREFTNSLRGQKHLTLTSAGEELLRKSMDFWNQASSSAARVFNVGDLVALGTSVEQFEYALKKLVTLYHEEDNADWKFKKDSVLSSDP